MIIKIKADEFKNHYGLGVEAKTPSFVRVLCSTVNEVVEAVAKVRGRNIVAVDYTGVIDAEVMSALNELKSTVPIVLPVDLSDILTSGLTGSLTSLKEVVKEALVRLEVYGIKTCVADGEALGGNLTSPVNPKIRVVVKAQEGFSNLYIILKLCKSSAISFCSLGGTMLNVEGTRFGCVQATDLGRKPIAKFKLSFADTCCCCEPTVHVDNLEHICYLGESEIGSLGKVANHSGGKTSKGKKAVLSNLFGIDSGLSNF